MSPPSATPTGAPRAPVVPVVLLTGFLGSGKTTLLNRLIAARAIGRDPLGGDARLALIVNELGEVGIDGALLPAELTRQVELPGGCICCVLNEDLDRTIVELLDAAPDVGTIVIETTGVAEPLPIAWTLQGEALLDRVRLAAIVTTVDAIGFVDQRPLSPAVDAQVHEADLVVLTKTDVADPGQAARARAAVRELAPDVPIVEGAPDEIVAWLARVMREPDAPAARAPAAPAHRHGPGHGFDTAWTEIPGTVDLEELEEALGALPASYVRIKGIARAVDGRTGSDAPFWAAIHRVGLRVSTERLGGPGPTRIVALGPGVAAGPLAACVRRAVLSSGPEQPP